MPQHTSTIHQPHRPPHRSGKYASLKVNVGVITLNIDFESKTERTLFANQKENIKYKEILIENYINVSNYFCFYYTECISNTGLIFLPHSEWSTIYMILYDCV